MYKKSIGFEFMSNFFTLILLPQHKQAFKLSPIGAPWTVLACKWFLANYISGGHL